MGAKVGATAASRDRRLPPVDGEADVRFRGLLGVHGFDPEEQFGGRYVEWEWQHSRYLFESLPTRLDGSSALELGCHLGATAIVLALLGADVTAVDVDPICVRLAQANAARYGAARRVRFVHAAQGAPLPAPSRSFDLVVCNSVLEYVRPAALPLLLSDIDRVLRPGGLVVVFGTSNRLWPRERHSGQWLSNYVPRAADRLWPKWRLRRGISAWQVTAALPGYRDLLLDLPSLLLQARRQMSPRVAPVCLLDLAARVLRPLGISIGMLFPTLTLLLRKPQPLVSRIGGTATTTAPRSTQA